MDGGSSVDKRAEADLTGRGSSDAPKTSPKIPMICHATRAHGSYVTRN